MRTLWGLNDLGHGGFNCRTDLNPQLHITLQVLTGQVLVLEMNYGFRFSVLHEINIHKQIPLFIYLHRF